MKPPDEFPDAIAEREVVLRLFDGTTSPYVVRFKAPCPSGDDWECTYEIRGAGICKRMSIFGVDAVQALYLAMRVIPAELEHLGRSRGGRFEWQGQHDLGFPDVPAKP